MFKNTLPLLILILLASFSPPAHADLGDLDLTKNPTKPFDPMSPFMFERQVAIALKPVEENLMREWANLKPVYCSGALNGKDALEKMSRLAIENLEIIKIITKGKSPELAQAMNAVTRAFDFMFQEFTDDLTSQNIIPTTEAAAQKQYSALNAAKNFAALYQTEVAYFGEGYEPINELNNNERFEKLDKYFAHLAIAAPFVAYNLDVSEFRPLTTIIFALMPISLPPARRALTNLVLRPRHYFRTMFQWGSRFTEAEWRERTEIANQLWEMNKTLPLERQVSAEAIDRVTTDRGPLYEMLKTHLFKSDLIVSEFDGMIGSEYELFDFISRHDPSPPSVPNDNGF